MKQEKKSAKKRDNNEAYRTTIEKIGKGTNFHVISASGKIEKKVYVRDDYSREEGKYQAHNYWDINNFRSFEKGQLILANPDF